MINFYQRFKARRQLLKILSDIEVALEKSTTSEELDAVESVINFLIYINNFYNLISEEDVKW